MFVGKPNPLNPDEILESQEESAALRILILKKIHNVACGLNRMSPAERSAYMVDKDLADCNRKRRSEIFDHRVKKRITKMGNLPTVTSLDFIQINLQAALARLVIDHNLTDIRDSSVEIYQDTRVIYQALQAKLHAFSLLWTTSFCRSF